MADPTLLSATDPADLSSDPPDRTEDSPIDFWPEGVALAAAGAVALLVAYRHRRYLARRLRELKRIVDEFRSQGGLDEARNLLAQLGEYARGD